MRRDVRTPADPQDFETTMSRAPVQPRDFAVKADGTTLILELLEPVCSPGHPVNTAYRVVYVPASLTSGNVVQPRALRALVDLGDTVAMLPAMNDGGRQRSAVAGRSADRGWYLCCPVGQRGVVGPPSGLCRTPWS